MPPRREKSTLQLLPTQHMITTFTANKTNTVRVHTYQRALRTLLDDHLASAVLYCEHSIKDITMNNRETAD